MLMTAAKEERKREAMKREIILTCHCFYLSMLKLRAVDVLFDTAV